MGLISMEQYSKQNCLIDGFRTSTMFIYIPEMLIIKIFIIFLTNYFFFKKRKVLPLQESYMENPLSALNVGKLKKYALSVGIEAEAE